MGFSPSPRRAEICVHRRPCHFGASGAESLAANTPVPPQRRGGDRRSCDVAGADRPRGPQAGFFFFFFFSFRLGWKAASPLGAMGNLAGRRPEPPPHNRAVLGERNPRAGTPQHREPPGGGVGGRQPGPAAQYHVMEFAWRRETMQQFFAVPCSSTFSARGGWGPRRRFVCANGAGRRLLGVSCLTATCGPKEWTWGLSSVYCGRPPRGWGVGAPHRTFWPLLPLLAFFWPLLTTLGHFWLLLLISDNFLPISSHVCPLSLKLGHPGPKPLNPSKPLLFVF